MKPIKRKRWVWAVIPKWLRSFQKKTEESDSNEDEPSEALLTMQKNKAMLNPPKKRKI